MDLRGYRDGSDLERARPTPPVQPTPGSIAAAVVEHETPIAPSASSRRRFVCSGVWCHQPPRDKTFSSDACVQLGTDRSLRCSAVCSRHLPIRSGTVIAIPESGSAAHVKENAEARCVGLDHATRAFIVTATLTLSLSLTLTLAPQELQTLDPAVPSLFVLSVLCGHFLNDSASRQPHFGASGNSPA